MSSTINWEPFQTFRSPRCLAYLFARITGGSTAARDSFVAATENLV